MTTGRQIRAARSRYTKQEWQRMTGLVAPLVANPLTSGGLDTDEGLDVRDEAINEVARDLNYMVPFMCRVRRAYGDNEAWAHELVGEAAEVCDLTTEGDAAKRVTFLVDRISTAFDEGGLAGLLLQKMPRDVVTDASAVYAYYLEDLFDDVVAAVEWQMRAMEDD